MEDREPGNETRHYITMYGSKTYSYIAIYCSETYSYIGSKTYSNITILCGSKIYSYIAIYMVSKPVPIPIIIGSKTDSAQGQFHLQHK